MRRMHRMRNVVVAVGVSALVATACGGGGDDSADSDTTQPEGGNVGRETVVESEAQYGGNLVVGISGESDGWTPQTNTFADAGSFVITSVIEPMAVFDENNVPTPYLAESWESNEDFTEWTIHLRDGVQFHDGEPLDAEAAKFNFDQAIASPLVGLALAPMIKDGDEGVVVVDDLTVQINLDRPWSALPGAMLAAQPGMMVSPLMFDEPSFGALEPVGTGPFVFDEWVQDDKFVAVKNPDYWRTAENGDELPYLDSIEFRVITDGAARAAALESGDIDMMYTTRAQDIADFREDDSITLIEDNRSEETFVQLNEAEPPFDNIHARRAAALAIDPLAVTLTLGEDIAEPINQPWSESDAAYNPEPGYVEFDLEAARAEVEAYMEDTGEDGLSFTMKGLNSIDDAQLLQLLAQQWAEAGIDVELENVEQTTFITDLAFANFQAAFFRNFSYRELDALYVFLHSSNAQYPDGISINFTQTKVDEIDALLDETRETSTEDREVWDGNYREIVSLLNEELPYIWLFRTPYAMAASPDVQGLNPARELGFGNFEPKWWMTELWMQQ